MIELGDKVKDSISGFTGIVVAITRWLLINCMKVNL